MSDDECISKHVMFSEISTVLEKVKGVGTTAGGKKDEILRRYFGSFEQFRREYCQKYGDKGVRFLLLRVHVYPFGVVSDKVTDSVFYFQQNSSL